MPPPDSLSVVYATDEHLAIRAGGDFAILCPSWQKLAVGVDGAFASGSPWDLTSASVDFAAQGLRLGHVVQLTRGTPTGVFKGEGELLAVDSAAGGSLTLRRIGEASSVGSPPAPATGMTAVSFLAGTMGPQIEEASYAINRRWNIDANIPGRAPANLYDIRDLREATVLTVLRNRYVAENRTGQGDFPLKIAAISQALELVEGRLEIRWGSAASDQPTTSVFTMRLTR